MAGTCEPATKPDVPAIKPETLLSIIHYSEYATKKGRAKETVTSQIRILKQIARNCNLDNPEEAADTISKMTCANATKRKAVFTYTSYLKSKGLKWEKPTYKEEERIPFIPTEAELDQLIASCKTRMATLLQTLKETGIRISEALKLKWIDVDKQRKLLSITPSKGSNPRILPITDKLIGMLNNLNQNKEHVFANKISSIQTVYCGIRNNTANILQNPRIKRISFHTFRHWKGTMEYHATKDIMHVRYVLGHKAIKTTLIYINIEQALYLNDTDQWLCKVAHNEQQAIQLIEANFQYVNNLGDNTALYRKRK